MGISFIILLRNRLLHAVLLYISCTAFYSCSEPSSPFGQTEITLTALDASCTEVWLELKFNNLTLPADVAIKKDGGEVASFLSVNKDTIIYIDGLLPSQNYSFEAVIRYEGNDDRASNTAVVTTMDTTSHNFTWEVFEFGEGLASSGFYDVAMISENNIWVVGEIYYHDTYTYDSAGNFIRPYNAVHWDGMRWERKQVFYISSSGPNFRPINSVFAINSSDIWFGNFVNYKNGIYKSVNLNISFPSEIYGFWASENQEVYVVGLGGRIAKYVGSSWQLITSNTDQNLYDISSNEYGRVLIAGSKNDSGRKGALLQKEGERFVIVDTYLNSIEAISVATIGKFKTIVAGGSAIESKTNLRNWQKIQDITVYTEVVRAYSHNSIIVAGHFSKFYYFNGIRWVNHQEMGFPETVSTIWTAGAITNHELVIAGYSNNRAIIARGKRN